MINLLEKIYMKQTSNPKPYIISKIKIQTQNFNKETSGMTFSFFLNLGLFYIA